MGQFRRKHGDVSKKAPRIVVEITFGHILGTTMIVVIVIIVVIAMVIVIMAIESQSQS